MSTASNSPENRSVLRWIGTGAAFVLMGAIGLAVNAIWLHTGDVRGPNGIFVMNGGWKGFWFSTLIAVGFVLFGLYHVAMGLRKWWKERRSPV